MEPYLRRFLFFGWVSLCFAPASVLAETLRFATIDYCPFTCDPSKEDGKEGFMTDVLREALEPAGYTLELEMLPYVRAVEAVRDRRYDGIVVVGKDYAPDLVYPAQPTVVQRVLFLVNATSPWRYLGVESLADVRVGVVRGFHYVDPDLVAYLDQEKNNEDRVYVMHGNTTTSRAIRMLRNGRIAAFLEGEYSAVYQLKKMGIWNEVTVAGYTTNAFEDYTGFSPHNPNAADYAGILSDALARMKQSGRLDDILRRYGVTPELTP